MAKPFLKWAGGKTQLLDEIQKLLPRKLGNGSYTYVEPFLGSGAVLFWILDHYPNLSNIVVNDINADLINCYISIRNNAEELISILAEWEEEYHALVDEKEAKKNYYYSKREQFNERDSNLVTQSALFIFLNRTCFNGLYRVNRKNKFNVPIGSYKRPRICDEDNLRAVSKAIEKVTFLNGDFEEVLQSVEGKAVFYLDPPYKPLSATSSFTAYAKGPFDDEEQKRLKSFCDTLDAKGYKWILSNSDVKAKEPENLFFDNLYADFEINRVLAKRSINANAKKRGKLTELLITNHPM